MTNREMITTTIRITPDQHSFAKHNMGSLSHFVRMKLDEERFKATPIPYHTNLIPQAAKCYPNTKGNYCGICWPDGIPDLREWKSYRSRSTEGSFFGTWNEWIDHNASHYLRNAPDPQKITQEESRETSPDDLRKVGVIRRILRFIF